MLLHSRKLCIIEVVKDLPKLLKTNNATSMAHSGIFKEDNEMTTCRIVYLFNLKEKADKLFYKECSSSGANLNSKLLLSLTLLRFDKFLMIFDICKAFLQIEVSKSDRNRVMLSLGKIYE